MDNFDLDGFDAISGEESRLVQNAIDTGDFGGTIRGISSQMFVLKALLARVLDDQSLGINHLKELSYRDMFWLTDVFSDICEEDPIILRISDYKSFQRVSEIIDREENKKIFDQFPFFRDIMANSLKKLDEKINSLNPDQIFSPLGFNLPLGEIAPYSESTIFERVYSYLTNPEQESEFLFENKYLEALFNRIAGSHRSVPIRYKRYEEYLFKKYPVLEKFAVSNTDEVRLSMYHIINPLQPDEEASLKKFSTSLYTAYKQHIDEGEKRFMDIIQGKTNGTMLSKYDKVKLFIRKEIENQHPIDLSNEKLNDIFKFLIDQEFRSNGFPLEIANFISEYKEELDNYIANSNRDDESVNKNIKPMLLDSLLNEHHSYREVFSNKTYKCIKDENIWGIGNITHVTRGRSYCLEFNNLYDENTQSVLESLQAGSTAKLRDDTLIRSLIRDQLSKRYLSGGEVLKQSENIIHYTRKMLRDYLKHYLKSGKILDQNEDASFRFFVAKSLFQEMTSEYSNIPRSVIDVFKDVFGKDEFTPENNFSSPISTATKEKLAKIHPCFPSMLEVYLENDRNKILSEALSSEGYIRKDTTLFTADQIRDFFNDYIIGGGHLSQPPNELSKKVNRVLIYTLRSTDFSQLSNEKLDRMGIRRDDIDLYFSRLDINYDERLYLEKFAFFEAIRDSVIGVSSPDSAITKAFIDRLEEANNNPEAVDLTRLPTSSNLEVAISQMCNTPDFKYDHLNFSKEVLKEYISQKAENLDYLESVGLKRNLLKYAFHVIKNKVSDSLIDDNSWNALLDSLHLSGVVKVKEGQFTINPQASNLFWGSDELKRRRYLSQIDPEAYKEYLESGNRKEEDKALNEQLKSSDDEVKEVGDKFDELSGMSLALDSKKIREIDALFLDSRYGLITGITFGNARESANVAGVLKEVLKKCKTFDRGGNMREKLLLPVIEHTFKTLQSDKVSNEEKATLLSRLAQGLGDCNTPFIDAFISETLVMPPEDRKLDNIELEQLLENRALQKHFQKLVATEVKAIENSTAPDSIERQTRINAVKLPGGEAIENVAASVVIARGQFYFKQNNVPCLIEGLESSGFTTTRNLEFAVHQLKPRQLELLLPTICKTKLIEGKQVPIGKERIFENGRKGLVYEIDPVKIANITRKEKRILTMDSGIDVLGLAQKMGDHVAKVCSQDENILDLFDHNEDNVGFECPAIFNPNTQRQEFALRLEDQIAMGGVNASNVMEFLESEKERVSQALKNEGERLAADIAQDTTQGSQQTALETSETHTVDSLVLGRDQQGDLAGLVSTSIRRTASSSSVSSQNSDTGSLQRRGMSNSLS